MGEKYFRIKNWDKFQHYKGRNQIWLKLYKNIVKSSQWVMLKDAEKAAMIGLLCVVNERGYAENDERMLQLCASLRRRPDLVKFEKMGFIEFTASNDDSAASSLLAKCSPIREEKRKKTDDDTYTDAPMTAVREIFSLKGEEKKKKTIEEKNRISYEEMKEKSIAQARQEASIQVEST